MGDRAVYCARLESVCAERHPGFESPPIRRFDYQTLTSEIAALDQRVRPAKRSASSKQTSVRERERCAAVKVRIAELYRGVPRLF